MCPVWPGEPAPFGIDAEATRAAGEGVAVAFVEGGWAIGDAGWEHPALAHVTVRAPAVNIAARRDHGTKMVGIVLGRGEVRGLAPNAGPVHLLGSFVSPTQEDLPAALSRARAVLRHGDLLLLEAQVRDPASDRPLPAEAHPDVADVVEALVDAGIVVVAPAGNGGLDLDVTGVPDGADRRPFAREHAAFRDTGAILVAAACWRDGAWKRRRGPGILGSNHGARVDAFAWGEGVPAPGFWHRHDRPPEPAVLDAGETSAAAAIVAGALIRLLAEARRRGRVLPPRQLRAWLHEAGTPGEAGIGRMPDLARLVTRLDDAPRR